MVFLLRHDGFSDVFMCCILYVSPWFSNPSLSNSTLQSESESDSLVALFSYKPLDGDIDWSLVAKASPCYVTVRCQFVLINYHHHLNTCL